MRAFIESLCSAQCDGRATGSAGGIHARGLVRSAMQGAGLTVVEQPIPSCNGVNLISTIRGSGPLADRYVLIGAHYDHLGHHGARVFHGADDNAAAVGVLVELGRQLVKKAPEGRSVILVAFDAEEPPHFLSGAMGSEHYCANPTVPLSQIDMMVAMDLVGHAIGPPGVPAALSHSVFALGAEKSEGSRAHLQSLANATPGVVLRQVDADLISPLSDYWGFWQRKVPFVFLTCGRWSHYHTPQDTPEKLDYEKISALAKWLEQWTRSTCARPAPITFTGARDDAGSLTSIIELLGHLEPVFPPAAQARAQARQLLAQCDAKGQLPNPDMLKRLVGQIETVL